MTPERTIPTRTQIPPPVGDGGDGAEEEIIISGVIESGEEKDAKEKIGTLIYWADLEYWVGSKVTVKDASYSEGEYSLTFDQEGSCTFGLQLFLAERLTQNTTYIVYGEFTSSADNKITINGSEIELLADEKQEVSTAVTGTGAVQTVLSVQYNIDGQATGKSLKVSNLKIFQIDAANLELKKLTLSLKSTEIAVGDTTDAVISGEYDYKDSSNKTYTLTQDASGSATLISSATNVATVNGSKITGVSVGESNITGKIGNITSDEVKLTVTADKDYGKYFTIDKANEHGEEAAKKNPGYMHLWFGEEAVVDSVKATATDYSVNRTAVGKQWYGTQLFYAESAGSYNVSFKVKSSVAGKITITGAKKDIKELQADEDLDISFTKDLTETDTLISIQLGVENGNEILPAGTFTISDFSVTKVN